MNLYIATEQRFFAYEGAFYGVAMGEYAFWAQYLSVFKAVYIVARVQTVTELPIAAVRADGLNVHVVALPNYQGLNGAWRIPKLFAALKKVANEDAAYILRVPGAIGTMLAWWLRWYKRPFSLEVVVDPYHSLSPEALQTFWARPVRALLVHTLKQQCQQAEGVAYVTEKTLQERYPARGFTAVYSSLNLPNHYFQIAHQRASQLATQPPRLLFIGSLWQRHKGLHILLEALHLCAQRGFCPRLDILGDGTNRASYETLAQELALTDQIHFHGYVPHGPAFNAHLQKATLFVLPTLGEGLPRAMIEAMATGLPVIGSNVTGIPELLPAEDMVPPNNARALANKLQAVLSNPQRLLAMSQRNYKKAHRYRADQLQQRRQAFYSQVKSKVGHRRRLKSTASNKSTLKRTKRSC